MTVKQSYNNWAQQYDANENKTRDLEARALREVLSQIDFNSCLEIGCGTGKNTEWLITKAMEVLGVDFSEEMLAIAKKKVSSDRAHFIQADINQPWGFIYKKYDLVTFSLVLEHIENLDHIFHQASKSVAENGYVYIGELHPYKQYSGTKARFDTEDGEHILTCYNHNISDFTRSARQSGLKIVSLDEYFDDDDRNIPPRILAVLFRKS